LNASTATRSLLALAIASTLAGCTTFDRTFRTPTPIDKFPTQTTPRTMERENSTGLDEHPAEAAITVDETSFMVRPMRPQRLEVPDDFFVMPTSATESGIADALQLALEGSGLTLNIEGGPRAFERFGATSIQNVRGPLRKVLDTLSERIGFFWSASDGTLTIEPDQMFVVELPPVLGEDSLASMTNTIQFLGARDAYLDRMARTLVFRANRKALKEVDQYLDSVRATRSMLVYEIQVFQVDLSDGNTEGVSWNAMTGSSIDRSKTVVDGVSSIASDLAKSFKLTSSGAGLGAVIMGPRFSVDALVQFLKTQGAVKTVSQPRLAMLNGAKGMLRVGQTTTYVSKVGSNLAGTGVSQVTVETKDLRTGLELALTGEEHDSTIYTRISLELSELLRFNKYTTLGTDLSLPDVTDRELKTAIRLPAGYTALLGGITVTREIDDRQKGIQTNTTTQTVQRSEIVMVVKPTVVRFKKKTAPFVAEVAQAATPAAPKREAMLIAPEERPVHIEAVGAPAKPGQSPVAEGK
jgi:MSHA biogenesis protein MshL